MKKQQFGERQYETAANIELAHGAASPFVPTQNVEYYLGFDAAHNPQAAHAIWRILSVHVPKRIVISPGLWPRLPRRFHEEAMGRYVSLFLQYKMAIYQDHKRAKHFEKIGGPYYQAAITGHQQRRLVELEERIKGRALVRYAAPAFWQRTEFDHHDARREILRHSAFTSPKTVGSHRAWMFQPRNGKAYFNPEFEETNGEGWEALVPVLTERAQRETLREHIHRLAASLTDSTREAAEQRNFERIMRLREYGSFSGDDMRLFIDLSRISLIASEANLDWMILLLPDGKWLPDSVANVWGPGWDWWWHFLH